jgi:hypothetical protein
MKATGRCPPTGFNIALQSRIAIARHATGVDTTGFMKIFAEFDDQTTKGANMRMSDEEYFRSCVAKERYLARLLGHDVEEYYESAGTLWKNTEELPKWTRDWNACGPLMSEYEITPIFDKASGDLQSGSVVIGSIVVHFLDHPSKDQAVRFAIVKAVIVLLEHANAGKTPRPAVK